MGCSTTGPAWEEPTASRRPGGAWTDPGGTESHPAGTKGHPESTEGWPEGGACLSPAWRPEWQEVSLGRCGERFWGLAPHNQWT